MCGARMTTPALPILPPARAPERLPNRGTVAADARRDATARFGTGTLPQILGGARRAASPSTRIVPLQRGGSSADTTRMSTVLGG